ncbi:MAG: hypothetical protein KME27_30245 [Lyngbya sp. HA4199-MV5]|nr:hypothetical protein [Lyngbya sp. HA4199-MV5]
MTGRRFTVRAISFCRILGWQRMGTDALSIGHYSLIRFICDEIYSKQA